MTETLRCAAILAAAWTWNEHREPVLDETCGEPIRLREGCAKVMGEGSTHWYCGYRAEDHGDVAGTVAEVNDHPYQPGYEHVDGVVRDHEAVAPAEVRT